jgi:hypothetical protein
MTRKLRSFAVALIAIFAMAATEVSAAQAAPEFWTNEHATIKLTPDVFGYNLATKVKEVGTITCKELTAQATLPTPELRLKAGNLVYSGCEANGAKKYTATVTTNGCEYWFKVENLVSEKEFVGNLDIFCPTANGIEFAVYAKTPHVTPICTVTVGEQTAGEVEYKNIETTGGPKIITANISGGKVKVEYSGTGCGNGEETGAPLDGKFLLHAESKAGKTIEFRVKNTP